MSLAMAPTQSELDNLKDQIQEQRRLAEYQKLKQDLEEITVKAVNTQTDLDCAMQVPDTDRVLDSKSKVNSVIDKMITRACQMCSIQPVIGPVVVLLLILTGPLFLSFLADTATTHDAEFLSKVIPFLMKGSVTMIAMSFVIIRSASRSLLLPIVGMLTSAFFCTSLEASEKVLHFHFNDFIILGVASFIALLISAISVR